MEQFERTGFIVFDDFLDGDTLAHLRHECDQLLDGVSREKLEEDGCVLEVLRAGKLHPSSEARTSQSNYLALRKQKTEQQRDDESETSHKKQRLSRHDAVAELLFGGKLYEIVSPALYLLNQQESQSATSEEKKESQRIYLFNEQYIVKPARSGCKFAWHTDEREQLQMFSTLATNRPSYVSLWIPLDDINADNGPLTVFPRYMIKDLKNPSESQLQKLAESDSTTICVKAGAAVLFTQDLWHSSSQNNSTVPRRVMYLQYSREKICCGNSKTPEPLCLAIPTEGVVTEFVGVD